MFLLVILVIIQQTSDALFLTDPTRAKRWPQRPLVFGRRSTTCHRKQARSYKRRANKGDNLSFRLIFKVIAIKTNLLLTHAFPILSHERNVLEQLAIVNMLFSDKNSRRWDLRVFRFSRVGRSDKSEVVRKNNFSLKRVIISIISKLARFCCVV